MKRYVHGLAALALAGAAITVAAGPSGAAGNPPKCPDPQHQKEPSKGATVVTGLTPGASVCYKAGSAIAYTTVDGGGSFASTLTNPQGKVLPIAYYVVVAAPV